MYLKKPPDLQLASTSKHYALTFIISHSYHSLKVKYFFPLFTSCYLIYALEVRVLVAQGIFLTLNSHSAWLLLRRFQINTQKSISLTNHLHHTFIYNNPPHLEIRIRHANQFIIRYTYILQGWVECALARYTYYCIYIVYFSKLMFCIFNFPGITTIKWLTMIRKTVFRWLPFKRHIHRTIAVAVTVVIMVTVMVRTVWDQRYRKPLIWKFHQQVFSPLRKYISSTPATIRALHRTHDRPALPYMF